MPWRKLQVHSKLTRLRVQSGANEQRAQAQSTMRELMAAPNVDRYEAGLCQIKTEPMYSSWNAVALEGHGQGGAFGAVS